MTTEEKIQIIESTRSFAEVPAEVLPPSHKESYYFVSYSHKDYKTVLADILRLEELGVNIWYDNEMHIGENWQEIAQLYISKFQCAGVIFYLTENSISSPACNQEVEYVLTHNKNFLSINQALPGRQTESGYAMLRAMEKGGLKCSPELLENFKRAFGDEILYLSSEESIEKKARQILSIPREDLLQIETVYSGKSSKKVAAVTACKDNTIINLDLSKIYELEGIAEYDTADGHIAKIDDCVFTNAIKLQSVRVSDSLEEIGESAFRNCISLTDIDLSRTRDIVIGKNAFRGCSALSRIDLTHASRIEDDAFRDCAGLTSLTLSGKLGNGAFSSTNITEVNYLGGYSDTGYMTFYNCKKLKRFKTENVWSKIGNNFLSGCASLTEISPLIAPKVIKGGMERPAELGSSAFDYCTSLEKITFAGDWDFTLSSYAFSGCSALEEINYEPYSLENLTLPIAFAKGCKKLKKMGAAEHFSVICDKAFEECESLTAFDLSQVTELGDSAFAASGIERVYLPKVEKIERAAFSLCKNIKQVHIGANCKHIGEYSFFNNLSLKSVKILAEDIKVPKGADVFSNCGAIEVFYLRSEAIFNLLEMDGVLENLAVLYIGDNLDLKRLNLDAFTEEESDEGGYYKFVQKEKTVTVDPEENIDLTDAELNEPDSRREKYYSCLRLSSYFGKEAAIKHARLKKPRNYFIEEVKQLEDGAIDYLSVSTHAGKSFRLDGTLIEELLPTKDAVGKLFRIPKGTSLTDRVCCLVSNGEAHYCVIKAVNLVELYGVPMPALNQETMQFENAVISIIFLEDDRMLAASGIDINSITVFNDDFEVEISINRPE